MKNGISVIMPIFGSGNVQHGLRKKLRERLIVDLRNRRRWKIGMTLLNSSEAAYTICQLFHSLQQVLTEHVITLMFRSVFISVQRTKKPSSFIILSNPYRRLDKIINSLSNLSKKICTFQDNCPIFHT